MVTSKTHSYLPYHTTICIHPHNDTLMVRLANGRLRVEYHIMLGADKRAIITTNWSKFRRRANIREGDICAFRFEVTSNRRLVLTVHPL
uniref:TF-B3 domain-containing protein n=1 Tax=Aegilops tauschii subsp. strangulata TaxID=200361 RepID=A0A453AJZ0_AEGTS